jgi:hypothetical protein
VQAAIEALDPADRDDIRALIWPWNETDSLRAGSESATFLAAATRFMSLEREMIGKTADELPLIWWSAIPYGTAAGTIMHRAAVSTLSATTAAHVVVGLPQTADSNPRGSTWNEMTGHSTGGDPAHRDGDDNRRFARLAAPVVARAILASGGGDSVDAIPNDLPMVGGPRIAHVYRETNATLIVTVVHDAGDDLVVPRLATTGIGFAAVKGIPGGSSASIIAATNCERISPTQLRLTFPPALTNEPSAWTLHYPYGNETIGRGNAVTDNFASRPKPAGWDVARDLGSAWTMDCPLASTMLPVAISNTPS